MNMFQPSTQDIENQLQPYPQRLHRGPSHVALWGTVILALGLGACCTLPYAPQAPTLPEGVARLAHELEGVDLVLEDGDVPPPESRPDPGAPAIALRAAQADLEALLQAAEYRAESSLRGALREIKRAGQELGEGSPQLKHLGLTTDALERAEAALGVAAGKSGAGVRQSIKALRMKIAALAERLAETLLRRAEASGVQPTYLNTAQQRFDAGKLAVELSDYRVAIGHFGGATKLAANTVTFDVRLFERNIIEALAGETTGHAFSIAFKGHSSRAARALGWRGQRPTSRRPRNPPTRRCTPRASVRR